MNIAELAFDPILQGCEDGEQDFDPINPDDALMAAIADAINEETGYEIEPGLVADTMFLFNASNNDLLLGMYFIDPDTVQVTLAKPNDGEYDTLGVVRMKRDDEDTISQAVELIEQFIGNI